MNQLTKQEKIEKQAQLTNKILWLPIILLLGVVPLIMRMLNIQIKDEVMIDALNMTETVDIYSNFKATAIIVLCVLMLIILFLVFDRTALKWGRMIKWYLIGSGLFIGISLISTILSDYPTTAWWGMPDRAEGFVITACYIFMMAYTLYSLQTYRNYTYIIGALGFLVIVSTVIGVFQYFFGYDLMTNVTFFKNLVLNEAARAAGGTFSSAFGAGTIFGTMFNPNYVGSFGAMMVPFFVILTLFIRNKWAKIGSGFLALCSMFLLFGSNSRAGLIGVVLAVLVGVIILGKKIIKKWKITILVMAAFVAIFAGFNHMTDGEIFNRISMSLNEFVDLLSLWDESFDYRDHIPVREVVHENNQEKIVFQEHTLYIGNENGNPVFTDEVGYTVEYTSNMAESSPDSKTVYVTADERFSQISFTTATLSGLDEGQEAPVVLTMDYYGVSAFIFMLDNEKGVVLADPYPLEEMEIEYPETFGFKGKERLGSARGYIWSRSIPMMKDTLLIGNGPDTYAAEFPQNDLLGKWWGCGSPNIIVDKVHNLYLAIFINNGGLALLGFFIMIGTYLVQSFRLYALKGYYGNCDILGIATMLAIIGYLGAGIFNDSVISVAPIFWILLGAGMGVNYLVNKAEMEYEKRLRKVIPIKE